VTSVQKIDLTKLHTTAKHEAMEQPW